MPRALEKTSPRLHALFPFLGWLPDLRQPGVLRADLVAGITVAMVIVPQSMAVARLAGLPAVYGLYAAFLPPAVAALFGSSRHLSTGPVALASLISAAAVQAVAAPETPDFVAASILLALMVGLIRLGLGVLRLGIFVNLLSAPVVVGFTNAAALIIATSQLHNVFGVEVESGEYHLQTLARTLVAALSATHAPTLLMALLAGAILYGVRRYLSAWPHYLMAVVFTTLLAWAVGYGGRVVGRIPEGLPALQVPAIDMALLPELAMGALTLTLIGLMEAMSIAKTMATRTKQRIDIDRELVGQGLANIAGSFFQSYAVSGSFSRSAVNFSSGARTGFASVVSSAVVVVTLLFLTPLFYYLPQATLAAIIVFAVSGLLRIKPLLTAWRVSAHDGIIGVLTFACTLALAPKLHYGIGVGVVLSVSLYVFRTMRPHVAYLGRHADGSLRDAETFGLALDERIAIVRFDGRLYFGDSSYFEDKILEAVTRLPELRYVVIDAGGINQIDASGEQTLRQVVERLRDIGIDLYITRAKQQFIQVLERTGTMDFIGRDHFFPWNQHALEHLWDKMEPTYKARSPLNVAMPRKEAGAWNI